MPIGSPPSDKYVVYTLDNNEDTSCSSGLEDGQIVFRDPEHVSLQEKPDSKRNGNGRIRSVSFESSTHWGQRGSMRMKCCCFWNIILVIALVSVTVNFIITLGDYKNLKSSWANINNTDNQAEATLSTVSPTPADARQEHVNFDRYKVCETSDCIHQAASVLSRMNTNANPCEDFYEFACGGFLHQSHMSWESQRVREVPDVLREKFGSYLEDSLSTQLSSSESEARRTVKVLYRDCKDEKETLLTAREKLRHLLVSLKTNNGVNMKNDTKNYVTRLLAIVMKQYGATPLFKVIVKKNGDITITNRYSNDLVEELFAHGVEIPSFRYLMPADFNFRYPPDKVLHAYEYFLSEALLAVFGNTSFNSEVDGLLQATSEVFELEMSLNKVWYNDGGVNYSEEISFCKNRMTISTLQHLYEGYNINWILFFSTLLDKTVDENFELCHVDLVSDISSVISEAKVELVIKYILTHTFVNSDLYKYVYRHFPKFIKSTSVYKTKDSDYNNSYCISLLAKYFPLSAIFLSNQSTYFESVSRKLFTSIKESLMQTIQDQYWIPETQRNDIISHTIHVNLSFNWNNNYNKDYSYMSNIYQENVIGALESKYSSDMKGIHFVSAFDQSIASYNSWNREIEISSLGLQIPAFYNSSHETLLYGSVGGLISQALSEVFDLNALLSHYISGTIDKSVVYTIAHHLECLAEFYNAYKYSNDQGRVIHVRGDLTKSSNFRDILSIHLAQRTFQKGLPLAKVPDLPGVNYTESQTFFISYAQLFCEKVTPKGITQYYVNNESSKTPLPNEFRIKGMMSNMKHFAAAFHCPASSPMNPQNRCPLF
ncbi:membrane metallo-endopeptidase-like 1 isoform X1 [Mytilus galloprovincialis]|uniref:membrane metallo-endopeptidase-like 1 isoform X1 n=1 Tax=Mytilus galloprovincialis TaxID=29158 RepID=UPI003F7C368D